MPRTIGESQFIESFARRQGRSLTASRKVLVENLLPKLRIPLPEGEDADAPAFQEFVKAATAGRCWMEIGFGGGEHLAHQAEQNPDILMIGCEPYIHGIASLLAKIEEKNLQNIRLFTEDARTLLSHMPDSVLDRLLIPFPDPWPKVRHHKRRLIQTETLDLFAKKLKSGKELRFITDDKPYAAWALEHLLAHPSFTWQAKDKSGWHIAPEDWFPTRYQQKAINAGREAMFLRFDKA